MRVPALLRLISSLALATWLERPIPAAACNCPIDPVTGQAYFPEVAVAFQGTAVSNAEPVGDDPRADSSSTDGSWTMDRYRMRVDRYFKGRLGRDIDVFTAARKTDCGFLFDRGTSYLVYAEFWEDGTIWIPFCSGTIPSSEADEVLSALGKGVAPDRSLDVVREGTDEEVGGCSLLHARAGTRGSAIGVVLLLGVASLRRLRVPSLNRRRRRRRVAAALRAVG